MYDPFVKKSLDCQVDMYEACTASAFVGVCPTNTLAPIRSNSVREGGRVGASNYFPHDSNKA